MLVASASPPVTYAANRSMGSAGEISPVRIFVRRRPSGQTRAWTG